MVQTQMSFVEEHKQAYLQDVRDRMKKLLKAGYPYVTSDTAWTHLPPPQTVNPKIMGQIFRDADFQSIGWTNTKRASSHGRAIQMFRLKV